MMHSSLYSATQPSQNERELIATILRNQSHPDAVPTYSGRGDVAALQSTVSAAATLVLVWLRQHGALMQDTALSRAIAGRVGHGVGLTRQMFASARARSAA